MRRAFFAAIVSLGGVACAGLLGIGDPEDVTLPDAAVLDSPVVDAGPLGASCRAIHARVPEAGSGTYQLASDGGTISADCDMDSFDGGWTLVTPSMIVEDKTAEDYSPGTLARMTASRDVDPHGGRRFTLLVTKQNCTDNGFLGPGHYFLVGELDDWTQIMATFEFTSDGTCWKLFGDKNEPIATNVIPFDPKIDLIGPQTNMARTDAGAPIPYDGRTAACTVDKYNFWSASYDGQPKSARVVLRRNAPHLPAGLMVTADCSPASSWVVSEIRVR